MEAFTVIQGKRLAELVRLFKQYLYDELEAPDESINPYAAFTDINYIRSHPKVKEVILDPLFLDQIVEVDWVKKASDRNLTESRQYLDGHYGMQLEVRVHGRNMEALLNYAANKPSRVLDVGCGPGTFLAFLIQNKLVGPEASCVGYDPSCTMLSTARRLVDKAMGSIPEQDRPSCKLDMGSVTRMPYPNGAFDTVLCFEAIHWSLGWKVGVGEIARVLAPGGVTVLGFAEKFPRAEVNPKEVIQIFQANGLKILGKESFNGFQLKRHIFAATRPA